MSPSKNIRELKTDSTLWVLPRKELIYSILIQKN